jgi:uncharacterized protein YciI
MQFILIAHDREGALDLRKATRPAHLDYWRDAAGENVILGGPLLAADGNPFGSVIVLEAPDEQAARALFEADPYVTAGLFELTTISRFRHVIDKGMLLG